MSMGESQIARLEERIAGIAEDVRALQEAIHGGAGVAYDRSVRGRLHSVETRLANEDLMRQALESVRAEQDRQREGRFSRRERLIVSSIGIPSAVLAAVTVLRMFGWV